MWKKKRIYLDWAAASPVSKKAKHVFVSVLETFGNPSSPHKEGREARDILESARRKIARLIEVKTDDVIFTSGATEANALAMRGHVSALIHAGRSAGDIHIMYMPTAHASIVKTAKSLAREGVVVETLPLAGGVVDCKAFASMIRKETALISMDAVCGETGIIGNTRNVKNVIEKSDEHSHVFLHVDASQAPYTERITRSHWGADMLVLDAQKVGGVRGIGALIAHRTIPMEALFEGGHQERDVRPGTEAVALASAFATALEEAVDAREGFCLRATHARKTLLRALESISDCVINTGKETVPNIVNISLLGRDTDYLLALLDEAGCALSTKSACESDANGSRVIKILFGDKERSESTLRISWGPLTRTSEIMKMASVLGRQVAFLDENRS